jgi:NADPH-dependent glutamate synthase beta subunit-like oxidoreductase
LDCRRNIIDEPVAINYLKRFAADFERESRERILPYKAPSSGRTVAVVGGGVEGLSTAFFTARLGHRVTVYDANSKLGGLLRSAIAKERLPEEILDWDIEGIFEMGVAAETGKLMGKDFTVDSLLRQDVDAVFLAAGGWDSRMARKSVTQIESPIPGTYMMVDLLSSATKGLEMFTLQSDVTIFGGGKLALDAAKICQESGAANITILFREDLKNSPISDDDIKNFGFEGLDIIYNAAIHCLRGEGDRLVELDTIDIKTRKKTTLAAQNLIIATGRFPELIFIESKPEEPEADAPGDRPLRWEATAPYKQPAFNNEVGLFAEGEVLADYSAAIKAIGAGRRAAASLQQMMYGIDPSLAEHVITPQSILQNVDHVESVAACQRQIMPLCSGRELAACGEIERGFNRETARAEASRCLQCGLICYEHAAEIEEKEESADSVRPQ